MHRSCDAFASFGRTRVAELMVAAAVYDHAARLRAFELVAQVRDTLRRAGG